MASGNNGADEKPRKTRESYKDSAVFGLDDGSQEERLKKMEKALTIPIVKYNAPTLVSVKKNGGGRIPKTARESISFGENNTGKCKEANQNPDALFTPKELELLVHNLYPDLTWEDDFCVYSRSISLDKPTKQDIFDVISQVEDHLEEDTEVSQYNITEAHENLLIKALDECIRQVILERSVHGILFRLIRNNLMKSFSHKRGLYMSSIAFYGRRDILLTNDIKDLQQKLEEKEKLTGQLEEELESQRLELESTDEKIQEETDRATQEFMAELQPVLNEKRRHLQKLKHMINADA